ncbi:MAG TPA: SELO family protein, partial [Epsilonproteobacteria bacterium]|nr:SELO family protein [Campylobacterota bacterium]
MRLDELTLQTEYLQQDKELYDITKPLPLENPYLISFNPQAAALIDLDISSHKDPNFVELLNGTFIPKGTQYFSMCYAGHQFGHYLPRLGDGRAHNLGSIHGWHLQTKGSGETLYSRMADGRATIRSSIREYLMSEAMHHLGIPTTRALGVIGSETKILRDQLHDAAIVMRMSPSWIRFGTFEYFYYYKEYEKLQTLADVVIQESYPHLEQEEDKRSEE